MEVDNLAVSSEPGRSEVTADSTSTVRSDAIHLVGVDDLNSSDIEKFLVLHHNKPFQIEWIDDSSLNIVYDDQEDAFQALVAITAPEEFEGAAPIAPDHLRRTKAHPEKPETELRARFALTTDIKANGSRAKSRYYLLHGEPTRKEDLARFGTRRSKPMVYGYSDRDILAKSNRQKRAGDLFPEKAPAVSLDDVEMDDLLPEKARSKKRGSRGKGSSRRRRDKGDLFADKIGPKKAVDDKSSSKDDSSANQPSTVYQNMDY